MHHRSDQWRAKKDPVAHRRLDRRRRHSEQQKCRRRLPNRHGAEEPPDSERPAGHPCRLPRRPALFPVRERESRPPWVGARKIEMPTERRPPPLVVPWVGRPSSCSAAFGIVHPDSSFYYCIIQYHSGHRGPSDTSERSTVRTFRDETFANQSRHGTYLRGSDSEAEASACFFCFRILQGSHIT